MIENGNSSVAVFRIFDDVFDSGGGTGFGDFSFVFSAAFGNLPDPNMYSVNSVFVPLEPDQGNGFDETQYIGFRNGIRHIYDGTRGGTRTIDCRLPLSRRRTLGMPPKLF